MMMMARLSPMMNPKKFKPYRLFWWVSVITVLLDQLSKWAIRVLDSGSISGVFLPLSESFDIVFVKNTGAAWGVLSGAGHLLGILAIVALVTIYLLRRPLGLKRIPMQWAFGFLVAGIVGNMLDRLFLGYVVDFIDVSYAGAHFPSFNLADCAITIGVAMYVLLGGLGSSERSEAKASDVA